jgi:hypothetical protein
MMGNVLDLLGERAGRVSRFRLWPLSLRLIPDLLVHSRVPRASEYFRFSLLTYLRPGGRM